jgi:hypothetical protein
MKIIGKRPFLKLLALVVALGVLAAMLVPWKSWIEQRLMSAFAAKGLENPRLSLAHLGFKTIALKDISIGSASPLTLQNLTVGYSPIELWHGDVRALTVSGLALQATQTDNGWTIVGLENLFKNSTDKAAVALPVSQDQLAAIPLDTAAIEKSSIHVAAATWQAELPLEIHWQKTPTPTLSYKATGVQWKKQEMEINAGELSIQAALGAPEKQWSGTWQLKDLAMQGLSVPLPPLEGNGTLKAQADRVSFEGKLKSADVTVQAKFSVNYALDDAKKSSVTIGYAVMPWNSGTVSVRDMQIPLTEKSPINATIHVEHASIDTLLQALTGNRATATGVVSGTLPITIAPDGTLIIHEGNLKAEAPGTITLAPEVIPGDNKQVALVREILKNLHYSVLSVSMGSDKDNKLSVLMTLEGNNPDVHAGRPVKLNVNLTGDVLDLIQQSMTTLTDPKKLLKQGEYEK